MLTENAFGEITVSRHTPISPYFSSSNQGGYSHSQSLADTGQRVQGGRFSVKFNQTDDVIPGKPALEGKLFLGQPGLFSRLRDLFANLHLIDAMCLCRERLPTIVCLHLLGR